VLYIDTSVLLPWTLTRGIELQRAAATDELFAQLTARTIAGATSFYALHEVYLFALDNAPEFAVGAEYGKAALQKILSLPLRLLPLISRIERTLYGRRFRALRDATDLPHAIVAAVYECEALVSYDYHFRAISHELPFRTPEDVLREIGK
jgi:hypothetical protein